MYWQATMQKILSCRPFMNSLRACFDLTNARSYSTSSRIQKAGSVVPVKSFTLPCMSNRDSKMTSSYSLKTKQGGTCVL